MKTYTIKINDELAELFEGIAQAAERTTENVLADALYKIVDIILRGIDEEQVR